MHVFSIQLIQAFIIMVVIENAFREFSTIIIKSPTNSFACLNKKFWVETTISLRYDDTSQKRNDSHHQSPTIPNYHFAFTYPHPHTWYILMTFPVVLLVWGLHACVYIFQEDLRYNFLTPLLPNYFGSTTAPNLTLFLCIQRKILPRRFSL